MIIQCRKCETQFRFDEGLLTGDGVWVRCSRCQNVFFQQNPHAEAPSADRAPEIPAVRISEARHTSDDRFSLREERSPLADRGRDEIVIEREREEIPPAEEFAKEPFPERDAQDIDVVPVGVHTEGDREEEPEPEEEPETVEVRGRSWGRLIAKVVAVLLLLALVAGGVGLWALPEIRQQALDWASPWLRAIPGMETILGKEPAKGKEAANVPIRLKDVRQRTVSNLLVGNLHVIEGIAVNVASYPVSKVRVRLVISDAYDVVLGERTSFCGNILSDAELSTLAEAEIQRELTSPQGNDVPSARVAPNGEVPFQIVFSQEQAGAIKTVVMPAGAERVP